MAAMSAFHRQMRAVFAALLLLSATIGQVYAVQPQGPEQFVKTLSDTVIKDLTSSKISDSQRVKRLRRLLVENFDIPVVAKFVLGVYWRRTSESQFKEFSKLYEIYVAHNYAGLFKKYNGEKVEVLRSQEGGNDTTLVFGRINQVSGPAIAMEMRIHKNNSGYKALDLKIEGVSMPLTHRKQFSSVISRSGKGVQGLIDALRRATQRFEAQTPSE